MKKLFLLLVAVLTISVCAIAQNRTIRGTVLDAETGEPLIGATVLANKGNAVATDYDGKFTIVIGSAAQKLEVSYIGYLTKTVEAKGSNLTIHLEASSTNLNEVMVVGYGTSTRSAFTGSATVVKTEEIEKTQVENPLDAIKGRVAGVQMTNSSGAPGQSSPSISIRGITSINAGTSPLIILDGAPYGGDLSTINTHDIESMTVLKDAASNAIYGARGANGVILITTKSGGDKGKAIVTLDAKWGANSRATQTYKTIDDPRMYMELYHTGLTNYARDKQGLSKADAIQWASDRIINGSNSGLGYNVFTVPTGQNLFGADGKLNPNATLGNLVTYNGEQYYLSPDNWLDEAYTNSLRQEYNFSVSNGSERGNFYASFGYLKNEGITPNSGYERISGRLAADNQATSWMKVGGNVSYANFSSTYMDDEGSSASSGNIFAAATQVAPIYPLYVRDANGNIRTDANGNTMYDYGDGMNAGLNRPVYGQSNAISSAILDTNEYNGNQFNGLGYIELRYKDFKFTSNNSVGLNEMRQTNVTNPYYGQYSSSNGIVYKYHTRDLTYTFQQILNYSHLFAGKHNVNLTLVHENNWEKSTLLYGSKSNMFDPNNTELTGAVIDRSASSYTGDYNNEGYIFRAQYDYIGKYFGSASFRRDGSSRFHPDHRWGNFWSVGGAWIISKEDFFHVDWVDMLKFKASYGEQGNDRIGSYRYTNTYSIVNSNGTAAVQPSTMGNENITWEKGGNFNAGFEFNLFKNRLTGSIEGFYRKTTDMLSYFTLPSSFGFTGYYDNVGDMQNGGLELDLTANLIRTKDFNWDFNFNMTWYKNKITRIADDNKSIEIEGNGGYVSGSYFYGENNALYTFYMPKFAGVNPENGNALYYVDVTGDDGTVTRGTTETYADATYYLCGTALPSTYGGFGTSLEYKDFDFSINFAYQLGGQVYDSDYATYMTSPTGSSRGYALHQDLLNAWSETNTTSSIPRFQFNDEDNAKQSDRFLTNASYLSLQNINFGYSLPRSVMNKIKLSKIRFYFAAENVWLWSKRQGLNPQQSISGGASNAYYAPIRTLTGGINVTF